MPSAGGLQSPSLAFRVRVGFLPPHLPRLREGKNEMKWSGSLSGPSLELRPLLLALETPL